MGTNVRAVSQKDIWPITGVAVLATNVVWSGKMSDKQARALAARAAAPRKPARRRLPSKPGPQQAAPSPTESILAQHPIEPWSVLKLTVPRLFDLTDDELESTYEAAARLPLASFVAEDRDVKSLARISIFPEDDTFLVLLSLTLDYFFEPPLKGALLKETIERFASLARTATGRTPGFVPLADLPVMADDGASPFLRFRIDSFAQASEELSLLTAHEITRWTNIAGRTEQDMFDPSAAFESLSVIHAAWTVKPWFFVGAHRLAETPEHKSYSDMVEDLLTHTFSIERDRAIIIKRLRLLGEEKPTLTQLGDSSGVTRERVRQIEARGRGALRHLWKSIRATRFILSVEEVLKASGGSCPVSELLPVVASTLGWEDEPNEVAFTAFLASCCRVRVETESGVVSIEDHPLSHVQT